MRTPYCIGLVDDDAGYRRALRRLLQAEGYQVKSWASAEEMLESPPEEAPDCLVVDMQMPGLSGLDLQQRLAEWDRDLPLIFLTGKGNIPMTVRAMRGGAVDFLTKPVSDVDLFAAVRSALDLAEQRRARQGMLADITERYEKLTPREREVMSHLITGKLNKQIAGDLGICEQTVKVHRMRLLEKMEVRSVAEVVRLAALLRVEPPEPN